MIDFHTDSVVEQEHFDAAIKFGVELGTDPVDTRKYIIAFLTKLLLHREKITEDLMSDYLKSSISQLWLEVLFSLEERARKVLRVESGSIAFTLFCPSSAALEQLGAESWSTKFTGQLNNLLTQLGIDNLN